MGKACSCRFRRRVVRVVNGHGVVFGARYWVSQRLRRLRGRVVRRFRYLQHCCSGWRWLGRLGTRWLRRRLGGRGGRSNRGRPRRVGLRGALHSPRTREERSSRQLARCATFPNACRSAPWRRCPARRSASPSSGTPGSPPLVALPQRPQLLERHSPATQGARLGHAAHGLASQTAQDAYSASTCKCAGGPSPPTASPCARIALCYVPAWVSAQRVRGAARATTAYQRLTGSSSALVIRSFSTASRLAGRLDAIVQAG